MSWKRGIRNNNPANLDYTGTAWLGLDDPPSDGRFCRFKDTPDADNTLKEGAFWGLRATGINALTMRNRGFTTLTAWGDNNTPPDENKVPPGTYGKELADQLGVDPDTEFDFIGRMPEFLRALVVNEETVVPYTDDLFKQAAMSAIAHGGTK